MVQIIGHRGALRLEPENTFKKAIELGVDLITTDRPDIALEQMELSDRF